MDENPEYPMHERDVTDKLLGIPDSNKVDYVTPPYPDYMTNGGGNANVEAENYERARLLGERGSFYRVDLARFPELLDPRAVYVQGGEFVGQMTETYYETGEPMSPYIVKDSIRRVREKPELLRDIMETTAYSFTEDEIKSGLQEREGRTEWLRIPDSFAARMSLPDGDPNKIVLDKSDPDHPHWIVNGIHRPYADNKLYRQQVQGNSNAKPDRFYMGIEISGVTKEEARERRENLALSLEQQGKLVEAWDNLLNKVHEQDLFAASDESYIKQRFLRIGKVIMHARHYAEIFNAPPTREGLAPAGEKLSESLSAWTDTLQNKAVAEFEIQDPDNPDRTLSVTRVLPNSHAYAMNWGMRELNSTYVQSRLQTRFDEHPPEGSDKDHFDHVRNKDNRRRAREGAILVDHFDLDAAYPFDIVWEPDGNGRMEIRSIVEEVAYVDSAKLTHPTARRIKERFGDLLVASGNKNRKNPESRRAHPRSSGSAVTLLLLPELSSDLLNVTSVETIAMNKADLEEKRRNPDKKVRQKKIKVTIDQKAFGARDTRSGKRVVMGAPEAGRRWSQVKRANKAETAGNEDVWVYEVTGLGDRSIWDEVQLSVQIDGETRMISREDIKKVTPINTADRSARELMSAGVEKLDVVEGTTTNATEIPKGLLEFYAWSAIYSEFTRDDFMAQYDEYTSTNPAKLKSLGKQMGVAVNQLANAHQLSRDTVSQLEEFLRITLTAGCVASIVREGGKKAKQGSLSEEQSQVHPTSAVELEGAVKGMKRKILEAEFVRRKPGVDNKSELSWANDSDEQLFDYIIENRDKGPMSPWEINQHIKYFSDAQLEEMKPLYSLLFVGK